MEQLDKILEQTQQLTDELYNLSKSAIQSRLKFDQSNHFTFMSVCFLWKQINHYKTIQKLEKNPDVKIIARAMLEGKIQLQWAEISPKDRGKKFRAFAFVHDWRLMKQHQSEGVPIPANTKENIEKGLSDYKDLLLTEKNLRKYQDNKPLSSDPYIKNWTGKQVWELFEETNNQKSKNGNYKSLCSWTHWGTEAFAPYLNLDVDDGKFELKYECSINEMLEVYAVAFHSLYVTSSIASEGLKFDFSKFQVILGRYLELHGFSN